MPPSQLSLPLRSPPESPPASTRRGSSVATLGGSSRATASTVAGSLDPPLPFGGPRERQGENQSNDIASRVVIGLSHNSFTDLHDRVCPSTRAFKITSVIGLSEISVPTQMCINQQPRQFNQQPGLMDSNCWLIFECRFVVQVGNEFDEHATFPLKLALLTPPFLMVTRYIT